MVRVNRAPSTEFEPGVQVSTSDMHPQQTAFVSRAFGVYKSRTPREEPSSSFYARKSVKLVSLLAQDSYKQKRKPASSSLQKVTIDITIVKHSSISISISTSSNSMSMVFLLV